MDSGYQNFKELLLALRRKTDDKDFYIKEIFVLETQLRAAYDKIQILEAASKVERKLSDAVVDLVKKLDRY